jgi:hypothetical protein
MEQQQDLPAAAVLQQHSALYEETTKSGYTPSASTPGHDPDVQKDPAKSDDADRKREAGIMEPSSLSQIDMAIWESENASLEDEFSALEASLSTYLELQRRMFRNLGGGEARPIDAESARSEGARNRGLLLSDAVEYIQYLEELQQQLSDDKTALEHQVNGCEKKKS